MKSCIKILRILPRTHEKSLQKTFYTVKDFSDILKVSSDILKGNENCENIQFFLLRFRAGLFWLIFCIGEYGWGNPEKNPQELIFCKKYRGTFSKANECHYLNWYLLNYSIFINKFS